MLHRIASLNGYCVTFVPLHNIFTTGSHCVGIQQRGDGNDKCTANRNESGVVSNESSLAGCLAWPRARDQEHSARSSRLPTRDLWRRVDALMNAIVHVEAMTATQRAQLLDTLHQLQDTEEGER